MPGQPDISRLQGFSDAVFALAATLLVVTLEVPTSYDELLQALAGFPAFALAFAAIVSLWYNHRQFFAAYPVGDGWTVVINSVLLFVVLLYVYPLKLLAEVIAETFLGVPPNVTIGMTAAQVQGLYLIFGAAVLATTVSLAALHVRAWTLREELGLNEPGRYELRMELQVYGMIMVAPMLSMLAAALGVGIEWGMPLWMYLAAPAIVAGHALRLGEQSRQPVLGHRTNETPDTTSPQVVPDQLGERVGGKNER